MAQNLPQSPTYGELADRLQIKMTRIVEKGLEFHEKLWEMTPADLEKYAEEHADGIRLKMDSFRMFFSRAVPSKGQLTVKHEGGQGITAEDLTKMGGPLDTLKQLANMQVVDGEVVSDEVEDAEQETETGRGD